MSRDRTASVLIGVPHTGSIHARTLASLQLLIRETRRAARIGLRLQEGMPVDVCRQRLVQAFQADPDWTHMFFVDSDMEVPEPALDRLLALERPIACLPCPRLAPATANAETQGVTTNVWMLASSADTPPADRVVRFLDPPDMPATPFECYGTGLACCLIRRDVLERMSPPLFQFVLDESGACLRMSEDAFFFEKARTLGYAITVDPSLICDHFKEIDLTRLEGLFGAPINDLAMKEGAVDTLSSAVIAVIAGRESIHAETASYLAREHVKEGRRVRIFDRLSFSDGLRSAAREFLREGEAELLFVLDPRTAPPPDFLDLAANAAYAATGLFRELEEGAPAWGVFEKNNEGRYRRVDDPFNSVNGARRAATLRATVIRRGVLERIGSAWIADGAGAKEAGQALAESLAAQGAKLEILPRRCKHFDLIGLRALLDAKWKLILAARKQAEPAGD